mmetsp:Transcript_71660/g.202583  ORF Transcript_71660/g.202583 Transcript_71660/m.202583 type:complete len:116 (-) Transcript_71660:65-412(-)
MESNHISHSAHQRTNARLTPATRHLHPRMCYFVYKQVLSAPVADRGGVSGAQDAADGFTGGAVPESLTAPANAASPAAMSVEVEMGTLPPVPPGAAMHGTSSALVMNKATQAVTL